MPKSPTTFTEPPTVTFRIAYLLPSPVGTNATLTVQLAPTGKVGRTIVGPRELIRIRTRNGASTRSTTPCVPVLVIVTVLELLVVFVCYVAECQWQFGETG